MNVAVATCTKRKILWTNRHSLKKCNSLPRIPQIHTNIYIPIPLSFFLSINLYIILFIRFGCLNDEIRRFLEPDKIITMFTTLLLNTFSEKYSVLRKNESFFLCRTELQRHCKKRGTELT